MERRSSVSSIVLKSLTMKVFLSCFLLALFAAPTVHGLDVLKKGSTLVCSNGRKFVVVDDIFYRNFVWVKGVDELKQSAATTATAGESLHAGSHSTVMDLKDCYSVPTLFVVKVASKKVIAAEVRVLETFGSSNDFAELAGHGSLPGSDNLDFYISTRYGPHLKRVFIEFQRMLSVNTILGIASDIMDHFEVLHNHKPHPFVWKNFDISNIHLTGKAGTRHKIYIAGFRSIEQYEDHGTHSGTSSRSTDNSGTLKNRHSPIDDIKELADTLVYLSRKDYMPWYTFQEQNPHLKGKAALEHWIGDNARILCPFIEVAFGLKPGNSIDHKHLKGLLSQQPHLWDWETKNWTFP